MALFRSLIASTLLIVGCSCLGAQEAEPTEHVRVVRVPGDVRPVRALQHSDGTVYVVSDSDRGPVVIHTKDFGKTFSEATPLVNQTSQQPGLQFDVWDAVLAPDGQLLVALGNNAWKLNLPKDQWGFFLVRRDPRTGEITPVANINKRPSEEIGRAHV